MDFMKKIPNVTIRKASEIDADDWACILHESLDRDYVSSASGWFYRLCFGFELQVCMWLWIPQSSRSRLSYPKDRLCVASKTACVA